MSDQQPASSFRPSLSMLGWALNEEENLSEYVNRAGALPHNRPQ